MSNKTSEKKLPLFLRILLAFTRVLLALLLVVSFLATAVVLDLQILTSPNAVDKLTDELLFPPIASHIHLSEGPASAENPVTDLIFNYVEDQLADIGMTREDFDTFMEESTISDFLADKSASYVKDLINGTENTTITPEEIGQLIDENKALIEETFNVTIDDQAKQEVLDFVEENNVSDFVHKEVFAPMREQSLGVGDYTIGTILESLRTLFSPTTLIILFVVDALLVAALFFASRMRLGSTLLYAGIPALLVGATLAIPTFFAQELLGTLLPPALTAPVLQLVGLLSPIHLTFLIAGAVATVAGIVLKCVFRGRL